MRNPYDERRKRINIDEISDGDLPLLEWLAANLLCAAWIVVGILMPIPTLILWLLNKYGIARPNPCSYYLAWAAVGAIVWFAIVVASTS